MDLNEDELIKKKIVNIDDFEDQQSTTGKTFCLHFKLFNYTLTDNKFCFLNLKKNVNYGALVLQ